MTAGSKLHEAWLVIRDGGWVRLCDVTAVTGYSERGVVVLLWWLTHTGWAVSRNGWWASTRTTGWTA